MANRLLCAQNEFMAIKLWSGNLLHSGDSSVPLGQSKTPSHTALRFTQMLWSGQCHCQLGQWKAWVGQSFSSLISLQSLSPSQSQSLRMQFPLSHRKWEGGQVLGGQPWCSSDPEMQSWCPSHSQLFGMQTPSAWHWNSSGWHIPGGLVAKRNARGRRACECSEFIILFIEFLDSEGMILDQW